MNQYVLTPDEARVITAFPEGEETTYVQAAATTLLSPTQIEHAAEGLQGKKLARPCSSSRSFRLTPQGVRVREFLRRQAASGDVLIRPPSMVLPSIVSQWQRRLFPSAVDAVLILPESGGKGAASQSQPESAPALPNEDGINDTSMTR